MKKTLSILIALVFILSSCGRDYKSATTEMAMTPAYAPMATKASGNVNGISYDMKAEEVAESDMSASGSVVINDPNRKIVYTADLNLETKEFDTAVSGLNELIGKYNGYISSQSISGMPLRNGYEYYQRDAYITAKIPAAKFDEFISSVSGVCNVTNKSVYTDDITDSYYDVEAHLNTLKLEEERLLEILKDANDLQAVVQLESALADVRYQIESLTSQIRRMDKKVEYSTVNLSLYEVIEYSEVVKPITLGEKLASAAKQSGRNIKNFFEGLLIFIIRELPVVILWIVLIGLIVFVVYKIFKRIIKGKKISFRKKENQ